MRGANRPGNGGLRTESNLWEHLPLFLTGSRNAPFRRGSVLHAPYVELAMTAVGKVMIKAGGHAASTEFLSTCSEGIQVVYYLDPFSDSNLPAPTGPDHS